MTSRTLQLAILIVATSCVTARTQSPTSPFSEEIRGRTMGTSYTIKLVRPEAVTLNELGQECHAELERLEQIFSLYRGDSELSRLNKCTSTEWQPVSSDLAQVAARAIELAKATGGAFDPTVGPLMRLWNLRGFSPDWRPPSRAAIDEVLRSVGWDEIEVRLEPPAILKHRAEIELDLNALVEGWAIDRVVTLLQTRQVTNALVELGGEFRGLGKRPDGTPWRVGLEDPRETTRLYARVVLNNRAVSTSGDYRQAIEFEGRHYSHIIDPRTGEPIRHSGVAVTVLAEDSFTADGWDTALLVLGPEEGLRLANAKGIAASFVERSPDSAPQLSEAAVPAIELLDVTQPRPSSASLPVVLGILGGVAVVALVRARIRLRKETKPELASLT